MVQNCSSGVRVEVGQRDETRGRSRYPPFGKKFPKFLGMSLGYSLGGSDRKNLTLSGNTAGAGHRRQVGFQVTGNEGSTMIGGGQGRRQQRTEVGNSGGRVRREPEEGTEGDQRNRSSETRWEMEDGAEPSGNERRQGKPGHKVNEGGRESFGRRVARTY